MTSPSIASRCRALLLSALLATLPACGGGSHGGGIGGSGIVFGAITGLGSVVVNDITFDTSTAVVTRNGEPANEADLALGMVVRIDGVFDEDGVTGIADTVAISTLLEGPIESLADDLSSAIILGGQVVFETDTVVDNLLLAPGVVGATVEVSGFVDANGNIRATRVVGTTDPVDFGFIVRGTTQNSDTVAETFDIRGVTIDYSSATLVDAPASGITDGLEVRVQIIATPSDRMAQAAEVRFLEPSPVETTDQLVKLEGIVTRQLAARRFVLGGRRVFRITDATTIVGGSAADIRPDVAVALVGTLEESGLIRARRLELRGALSAVPVAPAPASLEQPYYDSF